MIRALISVPVFALLAVSLHAGTISLSGPLTDDASTLISPANVYTHAISGGPAAVSVNGVNFSSLTSSVTPPNFTWDSPTKGEINNNLGQWIPADGGVTGPALISLLSGFTYAPGGAAPESSQSFTLSGLTIGTPYDARLYIRVWDVGTSGRPIAFTMTNGAEVDSFAGLEDRPGTVLGTGNQHQAYFVNYQFVAQSANLVITAAVPSDAPENSGSFHLYALTNQVVPEPTTALCLALAGVASVMRRRR